MACNAKEKTPFFFGRWILLFLAGRGRTWLVMAGFGWPGHDRAWAGLIFYDFCDFLRFSWFFRIFTISCDFVDFRDFLAIFYDFARWPKMIFYDFSMIFFAVDRGGWWLFPWCTGHTANGVWILSKTIFLNFMITILLFQKFTIFFSLRCTTQHIWPGSQQKIEKSITYAQPQIFSIIY